MRTRERSEYGSRLLMARNKAGLTQVQLSEAVGMAQSALAEAEGVGKSSSFTVRIAQVCGVSALWLESGEGDMLADSAWPFSDDLRAAVGKLDTDGLRKVEDAIWTLLALTVSTVTEVKKPEELRYSDAAVGTTNAPPAPKAGTLLDRARVGGSGARSQSGGLQKPRSGGGSKRAA